MAEAGAEVDVTQLVDIARATRNEARVQTCAGRERRSERSVRRVPPTARSDGATWPEDLPRPRGFCRRPNRCTRAFEFLRSLKTSISSRNHSLGTCRHLRKDPEGGCGRRFSDRKPRADVDAAAHGAEAFYDLVTEVASVRSRPIQAIWCILFCAGGKAKSPSNSRSRSWLGTEFSLRPGRIDGERKGVGHQGLRQCVLHEGVTTQCRRFPGGARTIARVTARQEPLST